MLGLFLLVFLTVALGIAAGYETLSGLLFPDLKRIRRRMAAEFGKDDPEAPQSLLFKNLDQLTLEPPVAPVDPERMDTPPAMAAPRGVRGRLEKLLEGAGVPLTASQLWLLTAGLGMVLGIGGFLLAGIWLGIPAAFAGSAVPLVILNWRRKARLDKYLRQLPGAFELMARVIRAGQSVPQAFQAVAEATEDPLASEFANCQKQQNLGLRLEVAFQELCQRSGILEMRIFGMAMLIQRQTGGNLSEVLERLAGLVRARLRLRERIRIFTAEGRLQGWTLVVLPFIAFAAIMVVNRQYAMVLLNHRPLLIGTLCSMAFGIWWIRKIVNLEV